MQRRQFVALLRNEDPTTGKRLTARMNTSRQENGKTVSNRQVGYGLVFGVPKSVSIYLAITGDQIVENIARSAVDETMRAMESEMQCKVRKGVWRRIAERVRCSTQSSSIAIPGRLTG